MKTPQLYFHSAYINIYNEKLFDTTDDVLIVSYVWTLTIDGPPGYDADFPSGPSITVTNLTEGNYTVTLTVTDEHGWSDTTTAIVYVIENYPPIAVILPPKQTVFLPNDTAVFNGSTSTDDVLIVSYVWELIDGPSGFDAVFPSGPSITMTDLTEGNYTISLTVTDEHDWSEYETRSI